jgi:hypothetical protein
MRRAVARFNGLLSVGRNRKTAPNRESTSIAMKAFILEGLILEGLGDRQTLPEELS